MDLLVTVLQFPGLIIPLSFVSTTSKMVFLCIFSTSFSTTFHTTSDMAVLY
jgi:hypothetical protein